MEKKKNNNRISKKAYILMAVLIISIIVLGVSITYAYFTLNVRSNATTPVNKAAKMNVTTTLESAEEIVASRIPLISSTDVNTSAQKVTFSVTNHDDSNVKAKYTIKLTNTQITKNLASKYFKWRLVITHEDNSTDTFNGNFIDSNVTEGDSSKDILNIGTKELMSSSDAITLDINKTDSIVFHLWLENDEAVDQIYLTEGSFQGRLALDAIATH